MPTRRHAAREWLRTLHATVGRRTENLESEVGGVHANRGRSEGGGHCHNSRICGGEHERCPIEDYSIDVISAKLDLLRHPLPNPTPPHPTPCVMHHMYRLADLRERHQVEAPSDLINDSPYALRLTSREVANSEPGEDAHPDLTAIVWMGH